MKSRNQYLEELIRRNGGYHLAGRKAKTRLLDEYCQTTGQNRDYVIRKLRKGLWVYQERRRQSRRQRIRQCYYDGDVVSALIKCYKIFNHPCGARLASMIREELSRLIERGEIICSSLIEKKLKKMSERTIDTKLKSYKEKENIRRNYDYKNNPLLYQKIPTKLSTDWDRKKIGNIQIDLVEHCGSSNYGQFVHTLSATDIATSWWEGGAQMTKSETATMKNIKIIEGKFPLPWKEVHPDNDSAFINWQLWKYMRGKKIKVSRSRPYHKNDNCFVEQKNSSHVRHTLGHLRYDTKKELKLINDIYADLRIYKNFFQSTIKLISKERIGGHIRRKYDKPKTPYTRIMEDATIGEEIKNNLREIYASHNPAELQRSIEQKTKMLQQIYDEKQNKSKVKIIKKLTTALPTFLDCSTNPISPT